MTSREQELEAERAELRAALGAAERDLDRERERHEATSRALIREQARHRETAERLEWAWEKNRVWGRVIDKLSRRCDLFQVEAERARMELAAYKAAHPEEPHG